MPVNFYGTSLLDNQSPAVKNGGLNNDVTTYIQQKSRAKSRLGYRDVKSIPDVTDFPFFIQMQQLSSDICTENRNSICCCQISKRMCSASVPAVMAFPSMVTNL